MGTNQDRVVTIRGQRWRLRFVPNLGDEAGESDYGQRFTRMAQGAPEEDELDTVVHAAYPGFEEQAIHETSEAISGGPVETWVDEVGCLAQRCEKVFASDSDAISPRWVGLCPLLPPGCFATSERHMRPDSPSLLATARDASSRIEVSCVEGRDSALEPDSAAFVAPSSAGPACRRSGLMAITVRRLSCPGVARLSRILTCISATNTI